jgi:prepilin-type processing-associated H-X9-DG protein
LFTQCGGLNYINSAGWSSTFTTSNLDNMVLSVYRCPSSPLPVTSYFTATGAYGNGKVMAASYLGIAGAVDGIITGYTSNGSMVNSGNAGICASNGCLFPGSAVKFADITDGTSNTMFVSEASDWLVDTSGSKVNWSESLGWFIGSNNNSSPPAYNAGGDNRTFAVTTIRYTLNQKSGWAVGSPPTAGGDCTTGVCMNYGNNTPLNSAHTGGVNVLMGDGTVRSLSNSLSLDMLGRLAVRLDGQNVIVD